MTHRPSHYAPRDAKCTPRLLRAGTVKGSNYFLTRSRRALPSAVPLGSLIIRIPSLLRVRCANTRAHSRNLFIGERRGPGLSPGSAAEPGHILTDNGAEVDPSRPRLLTLGQLLAGIGPTRALPSSCFVPASPLCRNARIVGGEDLPCSAAGNARATPLALGSPGLAPASPALAIASPRPSAFGSVSPRQLRVRFESRTGSDARAGSGVLRGGRVLGWRRDRGSDVAVCVGCTTAP